MRIIHITTEFAHLAKLGGIGDVVYGLSKEQRKQNHDVEVVLPKYPFINVKSLKDFHVSNASLSIGGMQLVIYKGKFEDINITLIDVSEEKAYFQRKDIYGYEDDLLRFIYYSSAAFAYLKTLSKPIDITHLHDWTTALVAILLKKYNKEITKGIVLTIHNLQHQGKCRKEDLDSMGICDTDNLKDPAQPQLLNLLKGGIVYSDAINTVSPTYAMEILTKDKGCGLEEVLKEQRNKLYGILNGIDESYWNPTCDPFLSCHLSPNATTPDLLLWKQKIRKELCNTLKLDFDIEKPLIISVTRLVEQKSPHLIKHTLIETLKRGGQFILLGSFPLLDTKEGFYNIAKESNSNNLHLHFHYDESFAHTLFAAADMIVIPSIFEPCGLTQMIALRYGTIPLVRNTGGLADTIFDIDNSNIEITKHNGFSFEKYSSEDVDHALDRAIHYFNKKKDWQRMIENGLKMHFNWKSSATKYFDLYTSLISQTKSF